MNGLVQYAGYDPEEVQLIGQFWAGTCCSQTSSINFAIARACRRRVDVRLASDLKQIGLRARHIGVILAHLDGRSTPYSAGSIYKVLGK